MRHSGCLWGGNGSEDQEKGTKSACVVWFHFLSTPRPPQCLYMCICRANYKEGLLPTCYGWYFWDGWHVFYLLMSTLWFFYKEHALYIRLKNDNDSWQNRFHEQEKHRFSLWDVNSMRAQPLGLPLLPNANHLWLLLLLTSIGWLLLFTWSLLVVFPVLVGAHPGPINLSFQRHVLAQTLCWESQQW